MDRLRMMWMAYLAVSQAAMVLRDPVEKRRMWERANRRLDAYFLELERELPDHDPVLLRQVRRGR